MEEEKKTYYKAVEEDGEYSAGMFFENREDALEYSQNIRMGGDGKCYVRAVKMTEKDYEDIQESD